MNAIPAIKYVTVEEYLQMEETSDERHEYFDGEVFAMAGTSFAHNEISANVQGAIWQFLQGKRCRIYSNNLKVHVKTKSAFVYPDLAIICNGPVFLEGRKDIVTNPSVIIEILSPFTQDFDHGKKFMFYRQIPTLREYILISSMEVLAEKFVREESGAWTLTEYKRMEDKFSIDTIGYQTTLADLYRDVMFENENDDQIKVAEDNK